MPPKARVVKNLIKKNPKILVVKQLTTEKMIVSGIATISDFFLPILSAV